MERFCILKFLPLLIIRLYLLPYMKQLVFLTLCLLILASEVARSEILASSGNPMAEANPSRNRQINKKVLCPDVAPGRTQVWNIAWRTILPAGWFSSSAELTQDDQGFIYLQVGTSDPNSKILKINSNDGSYDINLIYAAPFLISKSVPTHVKGNKMYIAAAEKTTVVNTMSMTDLAVVPHPTYFASASPPGSYAPLNSNFMVTAYPDQTAVNILRYLNSSAQFDPDQPNFAGVWANNVIVYKNSSGVDIPIVVMARTGYPGTISVWSPNYQFTIPGSLLYDTSYVQSNKLYLQYRTNFAEAYSIVTYDPETGALLQNVTKNALSGQSATFDEVMAFGNKSIGYATVGAGYRIVDFLNDKTIINGKYLLSRPRYSIPDNSVLLTTRPGSEAATFISLDWDTNVTNAVGSFPTEAYFGDDVIFSPPIIGEDCTLYSFFDDGYIYGNGLHAFKPLPLSDIVPILECINADGLAYFAYHSLEDKRIVIPYTSDRNHLEPMEISPLKDFRAQQRSKYFPLSSRVTLSNTNSSFTWILEDYLLSFNNTAQLRCPQDVRFIMYFNATNAVPSGFDEWTRKAFVTFTGISDSRVTVVVNKKRGSVPSDLEVELQVAPGNSTQELTPEVAVQRFAEGQLAYFNQQLATDTTYSPSNITLVDIDGTGPLATEISGTKQTQPLTQAPITQPIVQSPSNTDTPRATTVSSGSLVSLVSTTVLPFSWLLLA